jgi:hypothetical protein
MLRPAVEPELPFAGLAHARLLTDGRQPGLHLCPQVLVDDAQLRPLLQDPRLLRVGTCQALIARPQVVGATLGAIGVGGDQLPVIAHDAFLAETDLVVDRCVTLQVGRIGA